MKVMHWLQSLVCNETGQDLLEYGMLLSLIAVLCYAAVMGAGVTIANTFDSLRVHLNALPMGVGS